MCLKPEPIGPVPERTVQVAKAAFPKGNTALRVRDDLGGLFEDSAFAELFPSRGQPGLAPWRLALVTVLQFAEGLSDRQAAEAVRGRIDWKYALGLELEDAGFDFSVLSEFRSRLVAGAAESLLLDAMLGRLQTHGLLRPRGHQRTDSTHVLASVRTLNRLESLGETLRAALNAAATAAPDWVTSIAAPEWYERYAKRFEQYRLPRGEAARRDFAVVIGTDGHRLLDAVWADNAPAGLSRLPAMETLRRAWVHHFYRGNDGQIALRDRTELPSVACRFDGPYDTDARFGNKRSLTWSGYKAHLTETCATDQPHVIVHVATTPANVADVSMTAAIQDAAGIRGLAPAGHLVDGGYIDAGLVLAGRNAGIELIGPLRPNVSWQARTNGAYDVSAFAVDWDARVVTCPQGHRNADWNPSRDPWGTEVVHVSFPGPTCRACAERARCTRPKTAPREVTLRAGGRHEIIQDQRQREQTGAWQAPYGKRAGIEGCLSQAIRLTGLRRARYVGLAKTHLQHVATAAAINVVRLDEWFRTVPFAGTRPSRFAALRPA
ncbi:IS1182 family transposase [Azospirillum brasilense]|nr:IS1182 family transposase [Azospirillum brasilense]